MKLKFKKYIFLVNDITNLILKKEIETNHELALDLHKKLKIVSIFLAISLIVNIILLTKYCIYG
ncbi:hypothetical protein C0584_00270 [Candidatus Parcubacteria bacterium]|nr:MAG: hypothetical protein C0584_00270 [Candidatus Parcubacteria bacterium]